eukprot:scaffold1353_cov417-Prasinococcus_capsulatus_cf.AAC.5
MVIHLRGRLIPHALQLSHCLLARAPACALVAAVDAEVVGLEDCAGGLDSLTHTLGGKEVHAMAPRTQHAHEL